MRGSTIDEFGRDVARRLAQQAFLTALQRRIILVTAVLVFLLLWGHLSLHLSRASVLFALSALLLWVSGEAARVLIRRSSVGGALAWWDASCGLKGRVLSAWEFERLLPEKRGIASQAHLDEVRGSLTDQRGELQRFLSLRIPRKAVSGVAMVVAAAGAVLVHEGLRKTESGGEVIPISEDSAVRAAEGLADVREGLMNLRGLQDEAIPLEEDLASLATRLEEGDLADVGQAFQEVEGEARDLEDWMNEEFGHDERWASPSLIEALVGELETEDFGEALQDGNAPEGAFEAERLAKRLLDEEEAERTGLRLRQSLPRSLLQGTEEDEERLLVQHLREASNRMQEEEWAKGAESLWSVSRYLENWAQAESRRQRAAELTQKLREVAAELAQTGTSPQAGGTEGELMAQDAALDGAESLEAQAPSGERMESAMDGANAEGRNQDPSAPGIAQSAEGGRAKGEQAAPPIPGLSEKAPQQSAPIPGLAAPLPGGRASQTASSGGESGSPGEG
ncbi:MAG: hypothetical protein AAF191_08770, partial [Verrucomicrobiota bacterium]